MNGPTSASGHQQVWAVRSIVSNCNRDGCITVTDGDNGGSQALGTPDRLVGRLVNVYCGLAKAVTIVHLSMIRDNSDSEILGSYRCCLMVWISRLSGLIEPDIMYVQEKAFAIVIRIVIALLIAVCEF